MPLGINTNIFSVNAQRNLRKTESPLREAMQRLSSGLRINSAEDDAAGLAIATRMTTQTRALSVAIRNTNDGISVLQTAEGAMDEMTNDLQRIYELSEQAASYNTSQDRSSLNQEVSQLLDELSRIVNQTRYNGEKVLTGFTGDIQVGVEVNETVNINISNLSPSTMGVASNYSDVSNINDTTLATRIATAYTTATTNNVQINSTDLGQTFSANTSAAEKVNLINQYTDQTGVTAFVYGNGLVGEGYDGTTDTSGSPVDIAAGALVINGISIGAATGGATLSVTADSLVSAINAVENQTGVHADIADDIGPSGEEYIVLTNKDGGAITVTANTSVDSDITNFFAAGTTSVDAGENGAIILNQTQGNTTVNFDSSDTTQGSSIVGISGATATLTDAPLNAMTVSTASAANLTMLAAKQAMEDINSERAIIGAKLNRFESVIRNLDNIRENITAAKSRIMDADFAEETAKMTKSMILQQAGISVLSQANTIPQNVLALLRG
ncbi:MAG: flagellin [Nitrospirae bacterium]|nr:MAG: flagellin [Nitrospirota bacterium]